MDNVNTRNFLADAFLGRQSNSVAPATQYMQVPPPIPQPQEEYYSHVAHLPTEEGGGDYVDMGRSRSRSRLRRKKRYYYASSSSSSPEPRKRSMKPREYSISKSTGGNNNELIKID